MTEDFSFLKKIRKEPNGCWTFIGNIAKCGYGRFSTSGERHYAHRYSFKFFNGFIRNDLHVCHSCDNRKCVNPSHLWLGTDADNMRDKMLKGRAINGNYLKQYCLNGHKLNGKNLYIKPGDKSRNCIACRKVYRTNRYLTLGV